MKYYLFIFCLLIFLSSCQNKTKPEEKVVDNFDTDTNTNEEYTLDSLEEEEPPYEKLVRDAYDKFVKSYHTTLTIDSLFIIEKDTFHFVSTYSCMLNEKLVIPKRYYTESIDTITQDFITHPFVLKVKVHKNGQPYIDKEFTKEYFSKELRGYGGAEEYGVLLFPELRREERDLLIFFSISIPATDVGVGVGDTLRLD